MPPLLYFLSFFFCLIICLAYSVYSRNVDGINRQNIKGSELIGIFALLLCFFVFLFFYFVMARDSWPAFTPPLLCSLTNNLKSLLPIKTS